MKAGGRQLEARKLAPRAGGKESSPRSSHDKEAASAESRENEWWWQCYHHPSSSSWICGKGRPSPSRHQGRRGVRWKNVDASTSLSVIRPLSILVKDAGADRFLLNHRSCKPKKHKLEDENKNTD